MTNNSVVAPFIYGVAANKPLTPTNNAEGEDNDGDVDVDCKIFWEQTFVGFFFFGYLAWNLRDLVKSGESGKLTLKFVGFVKFAWPPSKLNSTASSENSPIRRYSKITLGSRDGLTVNKTEKNGPMPTMPGKYYDGVAGGVKGGIPMNEIYKVGVVFYTTPKPLKGISRKDGVKRVIVAGDVMTKSGLVETSKTSRVKKGGGRGSEQSLPIEDVKVVKKDEGSDLARFKEKRKKRGESSESSRIGRGGGGDKERERRRADRRSKAATPKENEGENLGRAQTAEIVL